MSLSNDDLKRLIELEAAATPAAEWGERTVFGDAGRYMSPENRLNLNTNKAWSVGPLVSSRHRAATDASLMVAARNAIAPLAAELLEARAKLDMLRTACNMQKRRDTESIGGSMQFAADLLALLDGKVGG